MKDYRQRFYIEHAPVRGEVVHLEESAASITALRDYPSGLAKLLVEMLTGAALLMGTFKLKGRLSIQAQGTGPLEWAMAECTSEGELRALAHWKDEEFWKECQTADEALATLKGGVLFVNIEPEHGERYQGIVALDQPTLAGCLTQYYELSAQTPTRIFIGGEAGRAGGLLVQLLPHTEEEKATIDSDLWPRVSMLSETIRAEELVNLEAEEILHRLFHEEDVRVQEKQPLYFHCTCSREKCEEALRQVGEQAVTEILQEAGEINMDCQFCNSEYRFSPADVLKVFGRALN